jgi:hypothetical protein
VIAAVLLAAVIHGNVNPTPRRLGAVYFNGPNESQVWVDLDAQPIGKGGTPIRVNFTVKFRGRELDATPKTVTIRATAPALANPLLVRLPVLQLRLADDTVFDLTAPGKTYGFFAGGNLCENCPSDTVAADIPFSDLEHIATSSIVLVNALGFEARLVQEDSAAIRRLIEAVRGGAVVKD